jgi:hypothetical protein
MMLRHQGFSVRGIFPKPGLPYSPSLETGHFDAPALWNGRTLIALNLFDAGCTGQSHGRGLYP